MRSFRQTARKTVIFDERSVPHRSVKSAKGHQRFASPFRHQWQPILLVEIRDQRASCAMPRASSGEPRKIRVLSLKGGGAAGVPRSTPAGLPRLLAGTRWRGERCARYAFISSASSNPSRSVDRPIGRPSCLLAVCSNKKVSNGGRWTPVGAAGWAGRGGRYRFHPAWRGERPPPSLRSAVPPRASSPSKQPTHFGSPGQSSRPPAHCCFSFEMGLLAAVAAWCCVLVFP